MVKDKTCIEHSDISNESLVVSSHGWISILLTSQIVFRGSNISKCITFDQKWED